MLAEYSSTCVCMIRRSETGLVPLVRPIELPERRTPSAFKNIRPTGTAHGVVAPTSEAKSFRPS